MSCPTKPERRTVCLHCHVRPRRYEKERGPDRIQLLLKLAPNVFTDAWAAGGAAGAVAAVEAYVERARSNVFGPDGGVDPEGQVLPLDLVQLVWWDFKVRPGGCYSWLRARGVGWGLRSGAVGTTPLNLAGVP